MAVFKCKMCGGTLEINQGESTDVCEYCGTKQTLPRLDDERKVNLYDRANHFRRNNDFDKAMGIYEQILNEDGTDAEAYWSLVLCRYGIEYVEDPATHQRVPTVNRAQYTSIYADEDYKSALQYADTYQKSIYEAEAKAIDEIQKGILEISQKEEPFDVFICYKETGSDGRRTPDSVLATELYHELTREGFKVFFSRITLEDKLGTAYEPYIFAALHSAKVMVALGTKPEYFNAVWVKNEWSRFLALIKAGERKTLIPAYKDMDPYDLPEEFSHLQAQDMSKLGFMSDLVRGINKILASGKAPAAKEAVIVNNSGNASVAPLLKRAFIFLEDGEWSSADEYCEKVLDLDPENAEAYLGKLMAELRVRKEADLADCEQPFDNNSYYQKAVRFGDKSFKERMENYRLAQLYNAAVVEMSKANSETAYKVVAALFVKITGFKDADEIAQQCLEKAEICKEKREARTYETAKQEMQVGKIDNYKKAAELFESIFEFNDSKELAELCRKCIEDLKNQKIYEKAKEYMRGSEKSDILAAMYELQRISGWKDSDELIAFCKERIEESDKQEAAKKEQERLEKEKEEQKDKERREKTEKKKKKIAKICVIVMGCIAVSFVVILAINVMLSLELQQQAKKKYHTISAGFLHSVAVKNDGSVVATGKNYSKQCEVDSWQDVVSVDTGVLNTIGLKKDGTVLSTGDNQKGQCDVEGWKNIIGIAAGDWHTLGLQKNGKVVATGNNICGECNVDEWSDIVEISAGCAYSVGLRKNGTVVCTNQGLQEKMNNWEDIISISAGTSHVVGLKSDGTVVAVGNNDSGQCDVSNWKDIIAISANSNTVAITQNGNVKSTWYYGEKKKQFDNDCVAVASGNNYIIVLAKDGRAFADGINDDGQCDVSGWEDIKVE